MAIKAKEAFCGNYGNRSFEPRFASVYGNRTLADALNGQFDFAPWSDAGLTLAGALSQGWERGLSFPNLPLA